MKLTNYTHRQAEILMSKSNKVVMQMMMKKYEGHTPDSTTRIFTHCAVRGNTRTRTHI